MTTAGTAGATGEALMERGAAASIETMYLAAIHIGRELGLYAACATPAR